MAKEKQSNASGSTGRNAVASWDPIAIDLVHLEKLTIGDLRNLWYRRFNAEPPAIQSGDVLRRMMAWKIQVEAFGDLAPETSSRIRHLVRAGQDGATQAMATAVGLKAGSILVREWRGVEQRVLVLDKGFEYRDRRFKSLSQVARAITGTHWSGPRFFGLEPNQLQATRMNGLSS